MLVIGLTGGIGSGKSAVAKLFAELNVPIIDTDKIAHALTKMGEPAYQKIIDKFGEDVLDKNKELNRIKLGEAVFSNPQKKIWLENLLHPMINTEMRKMIMSLGALYCIVVIPLLAEVGKSSIIDRVLVIDAKEGLRYERIMKRDGVTREYIEQIMKNQASSEKCLAMADDVIENNSKLENLRSRVKDLNEYYLNIAEI